MGDELVEREFMGSGRSKIWTYLILLLVLVGIAVVINLVWNDPTGARHSFHRFMGLPSWALATVMLVVGLVIFWGGLKIETDWPEAIGALLIGGAVVWGELIIGWNRFALGGLIVLPYLLPIAVFGFLLMYGMKKSA